MNAYFNEARKKYHANLLNSILTVGSNGIPSNADKDSRLSVEIAKGITNLLETNVGIKAAGQTSGSQFEAINMEFLKEYLFETGEYTARELGYPTDRQ